MANSNNQPSFPFRLLLRIPVPWVFVLSYLVGLLFEYVLPFDSVSPQASIYIKVCGGLVFLAGVLLASWSLLIFYKVRTTTTPGEHSKILITKGPYRYSRNPMYISLVLAYLGEAGFLVHAWPVIVLPLLLLYLNRVVIPLEEKILANDFHGEYEAYCHKVPRWFF